MLDDLLVSHIDETVVTGTWLVTFHVMVTDEPATTVVDDRLICEITGKWQLQALADVGDPVSTTEVSTANRRPIAAALIFTLVPFLCLDSSYSLSPPRSHTHARPSP